LEHCNDHRQFFNCLIHSIISGMHHYECIAPNVDISLQSGWFWAKSIVSFRERLNDSRSCWIVFIHVVWGRPGGLLQFSRGKLLRSSLHLFGLAVMQCGQTGRDAVLGQWLRGVVAQLSILHHHSVHGGTINLIPNSLHRHHWSRASILTACLLVTNCQALGDEWNWSALMHLIPRFVSTRDSELYDDVHFIVSLTLVTGVRFKSLSPIHTADATQLRQIGVSGVNRIRN